jgi:hypothetical protein
LSEETAVRIANALEALVMITQQLLSNEPEPEKEGPLTVMTQEGPVEIG